MNESSQAIRVASDANASGAYALRYTGKGNAIKSVDLSRECDHDHRACRGVRRQHLARAGSLYDVPDMAHRIARKVVNTSTPRTTPSRSTSLRVATPS